MAVPIIHVDQARAADAFAAHQALLRAEALNQRLKENPFWQLIRADAYEAFCQAFEAHNG